jgi:hypothetical protein
VFSRDWDPGARVKSNSKPISPGERELQFDGSEDGRQSRNLAELSPNDTHNTLPPEIPGDLFGHSTVFRESSRKTDSLQVDNALSLNPEGRELSYSNIRCEQRHRPKMDQRGRPIIYVDIDFVTFYSVIYFLYTGHTNIYYQREEADWFQGDQENSMDEPSPFALFKAADMYLIEPLRNSCFEYLVGTCTMTNISGRLFDVSLDAFDDLKKEYMTFMIKNFDKIKGTDEWREIIRSMNEGVPEDLEYQTGILLQITTSCSGDLKV